MTDFGSLLFIAIWSAFLPGRSAATVPISTYIVTTTSNSDVTLECQFNDPAVLCTWTGPGSQIVNSIKDYYNTRYHIKRKKGDLSCNLAISQINHEDEGLWQCYSDDLDVLARRWKVIFPVKPKEPVITYQNGTDVPNNVVVLDGSKKSQEPIYLPLRCFSQFAKPAPVSISWLFNGRTPPHHAEYHITRASEGLFNAETTTSLIITDEEGFDFYSQANVTCVVEHTTGRMTATKVFGRYQFQSVEIEQRDIPNKPGAKVITCVGKGFPPPFDFVITGPNRSIQTEGPQATVRKSGRYNCTAQLGYGYSMTTRTIRIEGINKGGSHVSSLLLLAAATAMAMLVETILR